MLHTSYVNIIKVWYVCSAKVFEIFYYKQPKIGRKWHKNVFFGKNLLKYGKYGTFLEKYGTKYGKYGTSGHPDEYQKGRLAFFSLKIRPCHSLDITLI